MVLKWTFYPYTGQCPYRHYRVFYHFMIFLWNCLLAELESRIASIYLGCKLESLVKVDVYGFWNIRSIDRHHAAWYLIVCNVISVLLIQIYWCRSAAFSGWCSLRAIPSQNSFVTVFWVFILRNALAANCIKSCHYRLKLFLKDIKIFLDATCNGTVPLISRILMIEISN